MSDACLARETPALGGPAPCPARSARSAQCAWLCKEFLAQQGVFRREAGQGRISDAWNPGPSLVLAEGITAYCALKWTP